MAVLLALHASIQAQDYGITLYPPQGTGSYHNGPLVEAADGNFYGAGSNGSIFRLTVDGVATVIAQSPNGTGTSSLLLGSDGNLYGTTGANNTTEAAVYRATTSGQVTLVGSIPSAYNPDDESTVGPLVQDSAGNLYGVIADGGPLGNGLIFGMTPAGVFSVIHAFSITDPQTTFNTDGNRPNTGLVIDGNGNLYGLTSLGGANGFGTIYQATTTGGFSAAYHFAQYEGADNPNLPIAIDGKGTVYYSSGSSVATFAIRKFAGGALSALYTFSALNQTPGVSGEYNDDDGQPAGITLGHDGSLYGVCGLGGPTSNGTTFRLTLDGEFTTLYPAGAFTAPVLGTDGNVYGVNSAAGQAFYRLESTLTPVISSTSNLSVPLGTPVSYQITATNNPTSYSADNLPGKLTLAASTGFITGLPVTGTYIFDVGAENADGSGYATITLTVTEPSPDAPVITPPVSPLTASIGAPFSYQIEASKSPSRFSATGLPAGLTVDATTGLIHGTAANFGKFVVQVQAANASGNGLANLEIDVTAAAPVPTVTVVGSNPDANATTGQIGDFTLALSAVSGVDVVVAYTVKGSAIPGTDYETLKGTVRIKAGKTSKNIKVVPEGDLDGATKKVVKLTLQAGAGYAVGTTDPVKVKIVATP